MDGVVKYGALEMKFWASPDASLVKKTEKLQLDTVSVRMAELERRAGRQTAQAAKQRERKKRQKARKAAAVAAPTEATAVVPVAITTLSG